MPRLEQIVVECTHEMLARWSQDIDAVAEMKTLARHILGRALLSEDFDPELAEAVDISQLPIRRVYASVFPARMNSTDRRAARCVDDHLHRQIASHRQEPREDLMTLFSRIGGLPEIVQEERTGCLVPPNDAAALAAAMTRVLQNRELAEGLGKDGREVALAQFGEEAFLNHFVSVYRALAPS